MGNVAGRRRRRRRRRRRGTFRLLPWFLFPGLFGPRRRRRGGRSRGGRRRRGSRRLAYVTKFGEYMKDYINDVARRPLTDEEWTTLSDHINLIIDNHQNSRTWQDGLLTHCLTDTKEKLDMEKVCRLLNITSLIPVANVTDALAPVRSVQNYNAHFTDSVFDLLSIKEFVIDDSRLDEMIEIFDRGTEDDVFDMLAHVQSIVVQYDENMHLRLTDETVAEKLFNLIGALSNKAEGMVGEPNEDGFSWRIEVTLVPTEKNIHALSERLSMATTYLYNTMDVIVLKNKGFTDEMIKQLEVDIPEAGDQSMSMTSGDEEGGMVDAVGEEMMFDESDWKEWH